MPFRPGLGFLRGGKCGGQFCRVLRQDFQGFPSARRRLQCHSGLPRNDVDVKVKHHLAACAFVELLDRDALCAKSLHCGFGDLLRDLDQVGEILGGGIEDVARLALRDD